jgi:predicted transcriptional regulator
MRPSRTVTISLSPELEQRADATAAEEGRSRSELFREALRQYLDRRDRRERLFAAGEEAVARLGIRGELDLVTDPAQLDELEAVLIDGLRAPPELARLIRRALEGLEDVVVPRLSPTAGPPASPRSASPSRRASSGSS